METAIRIKWGKLVPGRERVGLDVFAEVTTYFGKKLADGKLTFFAPFLVRSSDFDEEQGFIIVKGPEAEITKMVQEDEYLTLLSKGIYVTQHLKVDYLLVDEALGAQIERTSKVLDSLKS